MTGSHDENEITFYEELGVTSEASPEEIRDAFRLFVRLLHPDQQTDPQLKEIAEKQMRKLNRIYDVLSDPESRRDYDELLQGDFSPQIVFNSPAPIPGRLSPKLAWAAAIAVSTGLLIWLAYDGTPGGLGHTVDLNAPPAFTSATPPSSPAKLATEAANRVSEASQISRLRADLRAVVVERDSAIQELNKLRGNSQTSDREVPPPGNSWPLDGTEPRSAVTITELPSAPKLPVFSSVTLPRVERPATRKLAGFWFYAKPPDGRRTRTRPSIRPNISRPRSRRRVA